MDLRELSDLLGLSQTTVSRALNGYPEVKEATRKRVTEAAEIHNYHPNTREKASRLGAPCLSATLSPSPISMKW